MGLFILVSIGITLGALVITSGVLEGRYDLYMRTEQAEGLTQDTRVVLQGLAIGRVKQINPHLDPETNALEFVATLSIRERFPDGTVLSLPAGTKAVITPPPTLVGPTVIQLRMPPAATGQAFLGPGDTIPAERQASVMDALSDIAAEMRGNLEATLGQTRDLIDQTTRTVVASRALLVETGPQLERTLERLTESVERADRILAAVEPRITPLTDSVMTTLATTQALLRQLDSLASLATAMAGENRASIALAIEKLTRSAVVLEHFAERVSRRPLRMLTGVTPPPVDSTERRP